MTVAIDTRRRTVVAWILFPVVLLVGWPIAAIVEEFLSIPLPVYLVLLAAGLGATAWVALREIEAVPGA